MMAHLFKRGKFWQGKVKLDGWPTEKKISLGTKYKRVAQSKLEKLVSDFEKVASGAMPSLSIQEAREQPLESLCVDFLADMAARGKSVGTLKKYAVALRRLRTECGWQRITDVTERAVCTWRNDSPLRAKTTNDYLNVWSRLFRWLKRQRMVLENPFDFIDLADERGTAREYRRALTTDEALRLLDSAPAPRRTIYRMILESGLRPIELRRLVCADVFPGAGAKGAPDRAEPAERTAMGRAPTPSGPQARPSPAILGPCVRIPMSIAKNRKSALLPISVELAAELSTLLPANAAPFTPVFKSIPRGSTFRRDLAHAGISFVDATGRRADLHALRKTFGTALVLSGAEPRVVMEAMRHSDLKLTMKTYMDAAQLQGPVAAAVAKLPWHRDNREAPAQIVVGSA